MSEVKGVTVRISAEVYQTMKQAAVRYQVPLWQALDLVLEECQEKAGKAEERAEATAAELERLKARLEAMRKELDTKEEMLKARVAPSRRSKEEAQVKPLTEKQARQVLRGTGVEGQLRVIAALYERGYTVVKLPAPQGQ